jgi:hypothetical protein
VSTAVAALAVGWLSPTTWPRFLWLVRQHG